MNYDTSPLININHLSSCQPNLTAAWIRLALVLSASHISAYRQERTLLMDRIANCRQTFNPVSWAGTLQGHAKASISGLINRTKHTSASMWTPVINTTSYWNLVWNLDRNDTVHDRLGIQMTLDLSSPYRLLHQRLCLWETMACYFLRRCLW